MTQLKASAANISGHARSFSAKPRVTITTTEGNIPVEGLRIEFVTRKAEIFIGTAVTNEDGIAETNSGMELDPVLVADALLMGYSAVFRGDDEYEPITAHGRVTPGL